MRTTTTGIAWRSWPRRPGCRFFAVRGTKVYTADRGGPRWTFSDVHVLDTTSGLQSVFAGTASSGDAGEGGPATAAQLNGPTDVAFDAAGDVFIADAGNNVIRKVDTSGTISTVAGTGQAGFSGDGGPATSATLKDPEHVTLDAAGDLFISDHGNLRIREVTTDGKISTVAGGGPATQVFSCSGQPATSTQVYPFGLAVDATGNVYFASGWMICKIDATTRVWPLFAGQSACCINQSFEGMWRDRNGNLFVADSGSSRVLEAAPDGTMTKIAGGGYQGSGDEGPATAAGLYLSAGVATDTTGNVYIADTGDYRLRVVDTTGIIHALAGTGACRAGGDARPAAAAQTCWIGGMVLAQAGGIVFAVINT